MSATLRTGDVATGSVWNKSSWHWEEKDYNKVAQAVLKDALESVVLRLGNQSQLKVFDVAPTGFASISVRKGKKVVVFEFAISMRFSGPGAEGTISIPEFSNDELDPVLRVHVTSGDDSVKEYIRKTKDIQAGLAKFVEFINSVETGDSVLESDKQRREHEQAVTKKAEEEKGVEKKQIAEAVRSREQEQMATKPLAEASVWNVNSYHWETRKCEKWACEWISNRLNSDKNFSKMGISGEAENSIRKGKKISIFNLHIEGQFEGHAFSAQLSNEEGEDEEPRVIGPTDEVRKRICQQLQSLVCKDFMSELGKQ